jgi:hypothetical protein
VIAYKEQSYRTLIGANPINLLCCCERSGKSIVGFVSTVLVDQPVQTPRATSACVIRLRQWTICFRVN